MKIYSTRCHVVSTITSSFARNMIKMINIAIHHFDYIIIMLVEGEFLHRGVKLVVDQPEHDNIIDRISRDQNSMDFSDFEFFEFL